MILPFKEKHLGKNRKEFFFRLFYPSNALHLSPLTSRLIHRAIHLKCSIKCLIYEALPFENIRRQPTNHSRYKIARRAWNRKRKNTSCIFRSHQHINERQRQTLTGEKFYIVFFEFSTRVSSKSFPQQCLNYRNSLSRQSTNESNESDTPTQSFMQSTSTVTSSNNDKQPIKKSPREFIIPISVEGGGIVTPKANSIEPSESNVTQSSVGSKRISRPRRISSIFNERDSEDEATSAFPKLHRHTSIGRESDTEEPRFHSMHRLR